MGNNASNFFKTIGNEISDSARGVFDPISDTFTGLTTGKFDYSNVKGDWTGWAGNVKSEFTGGQAVSTGSGPSQAQQNYATFNNSSSAVNAFQTNPNFRQSNSNLGTGGPLPTSVTNSVTSAAYGVGGNLQGVTPPSHLLAISDPSVKFSIAASRGSARNSLQVAGNATNAQLAPQLSNTNSINAIPPSTTATS